MCQEQIKVLPKGRILLEYESLICDAYTGFWQGGGALCHGSVVAYSKGFRNLSMYPARPLQARDWNLMSLRSTRAWKEWSTGDLQALAEMLSRQQEILVVPQPVIHP